LILEARARRWRSRACAAISAGHERRIAEYGRGLVDEVASLAVVLLNFEFCLRRLHWLGMRGRRVALFLLWLEYESG